MKHPNKEKFKANYELLYKVGFLVVIGLILSLKGQNIDSHALQGLLWFLAGIIIIYLTCAFTSVVITDKKILENKVFLGLGFKINIFEITKIDRTSAFIFKHWGSRLQIYIVNERGQDNWVSVQESMYNVETLKEILIELKRINPSIEFHPHYEALVDGSIEPDRKFKKVLPDKELPESFT